MKNETRDDVLRKIDSIKTISLPPMPTPCVHLNGTDRETLLQQASDAASVVSQALNAVYAAAPNQRDFYPLGGLAWQEALDAHAMACDALRHIARSFAALAERIDEAP